MTEPFPRAVTRPEESTTATAESLDRHVMRGIWTGTPRLSRMINRARVVSLKASNKKPDAVNVRLAVRCRTTATADRDTVLVERLTMATPFALLFTTNGFATWRDTTLVSLGVIAGKE